MRSKNIRLQGHAVPARSSITKSVRKRKPPTDNQQLILAVIVIAIADLVLGIVTRQYMMLVAVNAPLIAVVPQFRPPR